MCSLWMRVNGSMASGAIWNIEVRRVNCGYLDIPHFVPDTCILGPGNGATGRERWRGVPFLCVLFHTHT